MALQTTPAEMYRAWVRACLCCTPPPPTQIPKYVQHPSYSRLRNPPVSENIEEAQRNLEN